MVGRQLPAPLVQTVGDEKYRNEQARPRYEVIRPVAPGCAMPQKVGHHREEGDLAEVPPENGGEKLAQFWGAETFTRLCSSRPLWLKMFEQRKHRGAEKSKLVQLMREAM